jgi:uncharacterized protein
MLGESHDLMHEFPEFRDRIAVLRRNDATFSRLMDGYDQLDAQIRELEELGSPVTDETIEDLKKQRVGLKDQLYNLLKKST